MIIVAFTEIISIGAVLPFIGVLTQPERVFEFEILQPIIVTLEITEPLQLQLPLVIVFSVTVFLTALTRILLLCVQTYYSHAVGADLSVKVYHRTLHEDYEFHVSHNSSEIIAAVSTKVQNVVQGIVLPALLFCSSIVILVSVTLTLLAIEPIIAIVALASFTAIYLSIMISVRVHLRKFGKVIDKETNNVIRIIQEGLGGIRDVIIDGSQQLYCKTFGKVDRRKRRAEAKVQIISGSPKIAVEALGMIVISGLAYFLLARPDGISSGLPVFGALAVGAQRMLPVGNQIYRSLASIQAGKAYLESILSLLTKPLPNYPEDIFEETISFNHNIELNRLSFRFSSGSPWILRDINFSIPRGSKVGIIGPTGSGKSTLVDVFMSLLKPTEGHISIDGVKLDANNYKSWQKYISHVPQSIFLTDATIAENIAFGVSIDSINFPRVFNAAQEAQISDTVETWEKKYYTSVGENGVRISGGQRQRIGIARALYKNSSVLVFDEATSALDNEIENKVMNAINDNSEEKTILIVAHRLTTLASCDFIIELDKGRLVRIGDYDEIIGSRADDR
ncbi:ABC transporter ATP-binding protein/permease [Amylibacter sp.]|nr:ABC transporter ATP-binding protein/permease [Amylibacter sp.]